MQMILVIDNYDSFVHNLARYFRQLDCETTVVRNDQIDIRGVKKMAPQAIVISPGPCTPDTAGCCLEIVKTFETQIPMLGICLGHQAIVQALGGSLRRANEPIHGRQSEVFHSGTPLFDNLPSPFWAGRYHSLVISPDTMPGKLEVTARTEEGTVMAVEHRSQPIVGLQFHPESILTEGGDQLLFNFLRQANPEIPDLNRGKPRIQIEGVTTLPNPRPTTSPRLSIREGL